MADIQVFIEDLQIARAIVARDESVTINFLYHQCYPMFKSLYDRYYTDCDNCKEFIDEIYVLLLMSNPYTGRCNLESYKGKSTLQTWLKTVCVNYCVHKFKIHSQMTFTSIPTFGKNDDTYSQDEAIFGFEDPDFSSINHQDLLIVLDDMPNRRYSTLIRLRYLDELSNEDTAKTMGMSLDNYYNKHKLAKEQFIQTLRKEIRHD